MYNTTALRCAVTRTLHAAAREDRSTAVDALAPSVETILVSAYDVYDSVPEKVAPWSHYPRNRLHLNTYTHTLPFFTREPCLSDSSLLFPRHRQTGKLCAAPSRSELRCCPPSLCCPVCLFFRFAVSCCRARRKAGDREPARSHPWSCWGRA